MNEKEYTDFYSYLKSISFFEEWEIDLISQRLNLFLVKKGTILLKEGNVSDQLYFVNKGCLRTFYTNDKGADYTRCIALEKSFCWTLPGFLKQTPSKENIEALTDSVLFSINKNDFEFLNKESSGFRNTYVLGMQNLCVTYAERVENLLTLTATERYKNLFEKNPEIVRTLPVKIVSSYLGITQESLSRIRGQL